MLYFDTAYLVRCYIPEIGHELVRDLADDQDSIASCELARVEFASAVHRKVRDGWLTARQAKIVWKQFDLDAEAGHLVWFPVSSSILGRACTRIRILDRSVPLRALDAIHLACARENGFEEIFSNDRHLLSAAPHFGLKARNILPPA
jgi:predicted nucleic acid-binding protein